MEFKPVVLGVIGIVLSQITLDGNESSLLGEQEVTLKGRPSQLFRQLQAEERLPIPTFGTLEALDARPWEKGKVFEGYLSIPLLGFLKSRLTLTEIIKKGTLMRFEGDNFLIRPTFTLLIQKSQLSSQEELKADHSVLSVKVESRRNSVLFTLVVKPLLKLIVHQQLRQILFEVRYNFL